MSPWTPRRLVVGFLLLVTGYTFYLSFEAPSFVSSPRLYPPPLRPNVSLPDTRRIPPPDTASWSERMVIVRNAFKHAYSGYEQYAFGNDEVRPFAHTGVNNLNGWGLTIVDSLDTMFLMELDEEIDRAMKPVRKLDFASTSPGSAHFFETQIRYLGGLLSAYYMAASSHIARHRNEYAPILFKKAEELGATMIVAFDTYSGLPAYGVDTARRKPKEGIVGQTNLAEIASCQVEYKYLAHLTGKPEYFQKPDKVMSYMEKEQGRTMPTTKTSGEETPQKHVDTGLWKNMWGSDSGTMYGSQVAIGALGDSAYEYLLKQYLLSGRTETRLLVMYLKSVQGIIDYLLYLSPTRNLLIVTDLMQMKPTGKMEHLSCFLPALLALGAQLLDPDYPWPSTEPIPKLEKRLSIDPLLVNLKETLELHMLAAKGLANTCYALYKDTRSGVGPNEVVFEAPKVHTQPHVNDWEQARWKTRVDEWEAGGRKGELVGTALTGWELEDAWGPHPTGGMKRDYNSRDNAYLLRPEAVEAMYILWRTTGDSIWRDRGWEMFRAIERATWTEVAYASLKSVHDNNPNHRDDMPSYFLAETLKYSYLLCIEEKDNPLPLDKIVFTTEAHPLPMFKWTPEEMSRYSIR